MQYFTMTRTEKLLGGIDMSSAVGIEIGALDKPIIPRTSPRVFYVDHADTQALKAKYAEDPNVKTDEIVNVGGIWGEKSLAEIASPAMPADLLIASHVIEHVPDLITWLREIASVLKPTGQARLAIPDRRYTFDLLRAETQFADVLSAYLVRARVPQPRHIIDHITNVTDVDCAAAWAGTLDRSALLKHHDAAMVEPAEALARDVLANGTYHDVHCWVFTPWSFAGLMAFMAECGLQPFECAEFFDTEPNTLEFIVALRPTADRSAAARTWRDVQEAIEARAAAQAEEIRAAQLEQVRHSFEAQLAEVRQEAEARAAQFRHEAELSSDAVAALKRSHSWRITAPLRAVMTAMRRNAPRH